MIEAYFFEDGKTLYVSKFFTYSVPALDPPGWEPMLSPVQYKPFKKRNLSYFAKLIRDDQTVGRSLVIHSVHRWGDDPRDPFRSKRERVTRIGIGDENLETVRLILSQAMTIAFHRPDFVCFGRLPSLTTRPLLA